MADVTFTHDDQRPSMDLSLEQVGDGAANLQKPIRVRLQPDLYDYTGSSYKTWSGLVWSVQLRDVEEGRRLREGLTDFFRAFGGSEKDQKALLKALKALGGGR